MCRKVKCSKCGKWTWAGCGMHIESALAGIKPEDRCSCNGNQKTTTVPGETLLKKYLTTVKSADMSTKLPASSTNENEKESLPVAALPVKSSPSLCIEKLV
mmetsp:Transcript_4021/g.4644  ORF Transcript_4021/g.4644 Transcript_4021/m.4644 type:complete len:101 (+) Transcript_4021:196-498(+)